MKLTFIYTNKPDLSNVSKDEVYKSYFEIPNEALELPDYQNRIFSIVQIIGQLTKASLHVDCPELDWHELLVAESDIDFRKTHFIPMNATYLHFANRTARKRKNRSRKLRILATRCSRSEYHYDIVKSIIDSLLEILCTDGNNWHEKHTDFLIQDSNVVNTFNRRVKAQEKAQKKAEREAKKRAAQEAKSKKPRKGQIYFIQQGDNGPIKIGYSTNPEKRLQTLNTASPYPLKLLHTIQGGKNLEKELHARFADTQLDGEWFEDSEELLAYIEFLKAE